ncbi:MAG: hypothetical protein K2K70_04795 [Lachnospiraceae bacterium]|nr:hypothetical protein [Lachnospiraceae bacterium]
MKSEYIPKVITLLAGAVVSIILIIRDTNVTYSLEVLLATLVIFYLFGLLAQFVIMRVEKSNHFIQQQRDRELEESMRNRQFEMEMEQQLGEDDESARREQA